MNRNEKTMGRIERMADRLRAAGVTVTVVTVGKTTFLEWTRRHNGYLVEEGSVHVYMNDRTGNLRFTGGSVRFFGTIRKIKTWQDAHAMVSVTVDLATYDAQAVTA